MDDGYYLYALSYAQEGEEHSLLRLRYEEIGGIESSNYLKRISYKKLCAIVSQVPLSEFGKKELSENIQKIEWLEEKARAHDSILRMLSSLSTILPVRFGTVFLSLQGIENFLKTNYEELCRHLETVEDCLEMGISISFDKSAILEHLHESDIELQQLQAKVQAATTGAAYLLSKKLTTLEETKFKSFVDEQIASIEIMLDPLTKAVKVGQLKVDPQAESLLVISLACLVRNERVEHFRNNVNSWQTTAEGTGITTRITGPWPPYSFSSVRPSAQSTLG